MPKTGEREMVLDYDPKLFAIVERRRRESLSTERREYVFTDSLGRPLSREWLGKRVWSPTIKQIGLSSRGQYNIRDTFITLALSAGEDPGWVAEVCGTSERMIFRHYREIEVVAHLQPEEIARTIVVYALNVGAPGTWAV
jgi:integrase